MIDWGSGGTLAVLIVVVFAIWCFVAGEKGNQDG